MKRKFFSIITALALCLSLCPAGAFAAGTDPDPQELELNVGNLPEGTQTIFIKNNRVLLLNTDKGMTDIEGNEISDLETEATAFSYLTLTGKAQGIGITVNADSANTVVNLTFRNLDITASDGNMALAVMDGTVEIYVVGDVCLSAPQMAISVGGRSAPSVSLGGPGSLTVKQTQGSMDCGMITHKSTVPLEVSIAGDVRMEAPNGYLFDNKSGSGTYPISIDAGNITLSDSTGSTGFEDVTLVSSGTLSINGQTPAAKVEKDGDTTYLFAGDLDAALAYSSGNDDAVFTLLNDVTRTETLNIFIRCTLDLGGRTIRNTGGGPGIYISGLADVTIQGEGEVISEGGHALEAGVKTTLVGGTFTSRNRASCGVCIRQAEGVLIVSGDVVMRNTAGNYGLGIYSAKSVLLSDGTYSGGEAAIWIGSDSDLTLASLLESGYAYHSDGTPIPIPEGKVLTGDVTVELCRHNGDVATFAPIEGEENRHSISCSACGTTNGTGYCLIEGRPVPDGETNHKGVCRCGREMTEAHDIGSYVYGSGRSEELMAYKSVTFCQGCPICGYVVPGSEQGTYTITPDFSVTAGQTKGRTLAVTCDPEDALEDAKFFWTNGEEGPELALPEDLAAGTHNYFVTVIQGEISRNLYVAVTVTQPSGGGGSGSGNSGSSGGSGGGYVPSDPSDSSSPSSSSSSTITVPVSGDKSAVHVSASVSGATATVSKIDTSQIENVIGENGQDSMVEIDFTGLDRIIDTVKLPAAAVKDIAAKAQNEEVRGLTVKLPEAEISFDAKALSAIQAQAGNQIILTVTPAKPADLNDRQKEAVGSAPVFDLTLRSGSGAITDFRGGYATVSLPYTLTAGQNPDCVVVYYLDSTGNITPCATMYDVGRKSAIFTTGHLSLYFVGYDPGLVWENPYSDVAGGAWYYDAVRYAGENGLMGGYDSGKFGPDDNLSRAQFAQILFNKEDKPVVNYLMQFSDVSQDAWCAEAIRWAASEGVVGGYGDGMFGPDDSITREQLAVMLWRYAGSPVATGEELHFTDADKASGYALEALRWAVESGILSGKGGGVLDPQGYATRAQAAQMLMNFLKE